MKSVDINFHPTKLCVYGDELWVGGEDEGVFVYSTDLQKLKHFTSKHFKWVIAVLKTDTDVIVCDRHTGLHVLNQRGDDYLIKQNLSGQFSDANVTNNTLFALTYLNQQIHVFCKSPSCWVKQKQLNLSGYRKGCGFNRLCTTSNCMYISCVNIHCVHVYSLTGKLLYKTGGYSLGKELKVGKFYHPIFSDVDSGGRLLLCDFNNHWLQVFDPLTRQWGEIQGVEGLEWPRCAGVGPKHLWVGTYYNKLLKYEAE